MKSKRNENRRTSVINSHNENQLNLFKTKCQSVRLFVPTFAFARSRVHHLHVHVQCTKRCSTTIMYALDFLFATAERYRAPTVRLSCPVPVYIYLYISDRTSSGDDGSSKRIQIELACVLQSSRTRTTQKYCNSATSTSVYHPCHSYTLRTSTYSV